MKGPTNVYAPHPDAPPHGNCPQPSLCDCECDECMSAWRAYCASRKRPPRVRKRPADVYDEVRDERAAQVAKGRDAAHDDARGPKEWSDCLAAVLRRGKNERKTWIKVASVAVAAVESLDRRYPLSAPRRPTKGGST